MDGRRFQATSPYFISGLGLVLFLVSVGHHASEIAALNGLVGPIMALLLDGLPALALVYAGYRLMGVDLPPDDRWRICRWAFLGGGVFIGVMALSLLVRAFEGRAVGEPVLPLLIAIEAGALAGTVAGYSTARVQQEARRAELAREALEFVNRLIRHDLRNDLSVIEGHGELVLSDAEAADANADVDSLSIIVQKAREAMDRIDTTGAIAEAIRADPELEPIDLVPIVEELVEPFERSHDVAVATDLPEQALVKANAGLRSVVDNVLENAVEHNDADAARVDISIDVAGEVVRLSVADNGPGLPAEQKERLAGEGTLTGEARGLALVQTLVTGYDGELHVEDNDPRGTVLHIDLPRASRGP